MALVVIDAGHGGANPGAVYGGRREKDDVLALQGGLANAGEALGFQGMAQVQEIADFTRSEVF